ncbi:MAG TPA: carboxylesterase [Leucothrix sp.]|nr:carboxylesterase [Leucothrix sp.]
MTKNISELPSEIVKTAKQTEYTIIWLHGLGADGNDFVPIVSELKLPDSLTVKFIFPHAPVRPITLNNGYQMRAWFDMYSLDRADNAKEDDILTAVGWINDLINKEVEMGTPAEKILLAGFSQGGVVAVHTGLRYHKKLAGIMMLSTYIPFEENLFKLDHEPQENLDIFTAHGLNDPIIPFKSWQSYTPNLEALGFNVEAHSYPIEHSVSQSEISDISTWLQKTLK